MLSAENQTIRQPVPQPWSGGRPLAAMLREHIEGDDELRRRRGELKNWLMRGVQWWDSDRRQTAERRLQKLAPGVPKLIRPASFTVAEVTIAYATDPRTAHLQDAWAAIWAHRIRGRQSLLLARVFDRLRAGTDATTGRPTNDPTATITMPKSIWDEPTTVVDTLSGDVLIGTTPAFVAVMISSPPPPRPALSESSARRSLLRFAEELDAMARVFSAAEAAEALQRHFSDAPMASESQVARLLRENRPAAWAHNGRRRAVAIPSKDELADVAAVAAREIDC